MHYHYEWDEAKAAANLKKHGVSFEEAIEVFKDEFAATLYDADSSDDEERWVTLGQIRQQHYLVVVHTYRDSEANSLRVRLISARHATKHEIKQYQQR